MPISRRSLGVMIAGAAAFFDLYAPQAVLPQLAGDLGVSTHQIGWVITVTTLAVALVGPFAGALADVIGRKRLIVAAALALAVPALLVASSTTFAELLVWRAVAGLLMPPIFCVTIAYIGEEWEVEEARATTALYMAGAVAGGFLGRFLCGLITDALGWRVAFASLAGVNVAIGIALLLLLPRERAFTPGSGVGAVLAAMLAHLRRREMLAACTVGSLILFAQVALFTYVILLLAGPPYHLGPGLLAAVSAVYLLGMVTTPIAGRRLRRFHERVPLSVGAMLFVAGIALTLLTPLWAIIAGMALASAGTFLSQSAATSFVGASAPDARSAAIGIYTTFYYVGGSIGAVAPGALWTGGGWPAVAAVLIVASVLAMLIAVSFWRARSHAPRRLRDGTSRTQRLPGSAPACG